MAAPSTSRRDRLRFAATVAASTASVVVLGAIQHVVVLGVELNPRRLGVPMIVGLGFGLMLAVVRRARAREHAALEALAAREAEVSHLNAELEDRVRLRTQELEDRTEALLRSQRLEVLGRMAGGVAHDFNNILTAVIGCAAALREEASGAPAEKRPALLEILDELDGCVGRARGLSQQLVTLGRSTTARVEPIDLSELVEQVLPMIRRLLGAGVELQPAPGLPGAWVRADRTQLEQLLLNLALNARDAMPEGGALRIAIERSGPSVYLVVTDEGVGMDAATRARMFEPFFTTKAAGKGTGLGLVVVAEVVRRASARIDVESAVGGGTRVCVTFPACEPGAPVEARTLSPVSAARPLAILLVEDDEAVRHRLSAALESAGHRVIAAGDALAGERAAREHREEIEVVVSDVVLPGPSGPAMVSRLLAQGLRVPVIFMSGYSTEEIDLRVGATDGAIVLQKPFPPEVLLARLARVAAGKVAPAHVASPAASPVVQA